jgi:nucleotide-binding universal stress UspA family protein
VAHGPPGATIIEYARSVGADLIVVGKRKRSMLGDLFSGDIVRQLIAESQADVLVAACLPDLRNTA